VSAEATDDREIVRVVGELTITIDRLLCVGFGDCIDGAPVAFEFDDEDIAILTHPEKVDREHLLRACESCPVDAITVLDAAGLTIVPQD
jgi:ferredoxin